jgi:cell division protein FtsI (penicillin-binding protein 3)
MLGMTALLWRAVDLQVFNKGFLQDHGDARSIRVVGIPAHRGMIIDRNSDPLAISTPVSSIWATPREVIMSGAALLPLAQLLGMTEIELELMLKDRIGREFVYIKRHVEPDLSEKIMDLNIPGVSLQREFRRYYPSGEVTSHIIGFTNVDDVGQEGLELAYDEWLNGKPGSKRVLKDRLGRVVENIESIEEPDPGKSLQLSIDRRIQYLAYRELKSAVNLHNAHGGSLVMLDAKTGEVITMVGQPSYNPNNRSGLKSEYYRNRAVTDLFEPGSTIKPFTIAAALESGLYRPDTSIDTRPGRLKVGNHTIRDIRDYGVIDVATVIKLEPSILWEIFSDLGFGQTTGSGFPGESAGYLNAFNNWSEVELATIAFGYGLSVTTLQLAQAYLVLAAGGELLPLSFHKVTTPVHGRRIISEIIANQVLAMLEAVVNKEGTGQQAAVNGYRVAGKTGTVHKSTVGGYSEDRYLSLFAGIAPVSDPRLVMVVIIDEPSGQQHYGGQVAAPIFSKVMTGALRLFNINPDNLPVLGGQIVAETTSVGEKLE